MQQISIGICAHNEEETVGELIEQVMNEDIPLEEVIVVVAGEDKTAEIVEEKQEEYDEIELIEEEEREGQIAAQNKILSRVNGDAILLTDGDGTIEPGSLETLYEKYDGENVVASKEIPITSDNFLGRIHDIYGEIHHQLCLENPRFSTQMGIFPSELIDSFPEIIHDDVYIEHHAKEKDLSIEYVPEAVKRHHSPNTYRFFFNQQKKNWAGRFQAERKGYQHTKPPKKVMNVFFETFKNRSLRDFPCLLSLGIIELSAYSAAKIHELTGNFPVKWKRPTK